MNLRFFQTILILVLLSIAFFNLAGASYQRTVQDASPETNEPQSFISIFEIPATDLSRAVDFYERILSIHIERMDFPEMGIGLFPYEGQMVTGMIIKGAGYQPCADGVTLYLNGGENLQNILD